MRLFFLLFATFAYACTDFVVQAKDGSCVNGRSLEFALDLQSKIQLFPRKQAVTSQAPGEKEGLQWTSKYGYLGICPLGMNFSFDGLNETGLSFGYLWLPGYTQYPTVAPEDLSKALDFTDFGGWVLGNFSTVQQVRQALKDVCIWGHPVPQLGIPPVHAAIHDAKGDSLVVEFVGGAIQVYDNPMSILTNSPPFPWQTANLQNYLNLSPQNPQAATFRGVTLTPPGQGCGLLGLPGDFSPASRFVKIATFLRFAKQTASNNEAVCLADHILNTVDIPLGTVRDSGKETGDYTQWIVIKDLAQKIFYFRSYNDPTLKVIDLRKLDFASQNKNSVSLDLRKGYIDVTDTLKPKDTRVVFRNF